MIFTTFCIKIHRMSWDSDPKSPSASRQPKGAALDARPRPALLLAQRTRPGPVSSQHGAMWTWATDEGRCKLSSQHLRHGKAKGYPKATQRQAKRQAKGELKALGPGSVP